MVGKRRRGQSGCSLTRQYRAVQRLQSPGQPDLQQLIPSRDHGGSLARLDRADVSLSRALDSLKAEEVQDDHAQTLLQGLVTAAADEPGLQIIVTTADAALPQAVSGVAAIITPKPGRTTLF